MNKRKPKLSLQKAYPEIAQQLHPTKNGKLTSDMIGAQSNNRFWWQCPLGHEWEAICSNRTNKKQGCQDCSNKKVNQNNCLAATHPHLLLEWHRIKNSSQSPYTIKAGSHDKIWWICKFGHEWEAVCSSRAGKKQHGCPYCSGHKVTSETSLAYKNPELAEEWHPTKNHPVTPLDVKPGGKYKYWWRCKFDHEWEATLYNRSGKNARGCPYCNNGWSIERIRLFVLSLLPYLHTFDQAELFVFCQQNGALDSRGKGRSFIKDFVSGQFPKQELEAVTNNPSDFAAFIENQNAYPSEDDDELQVIAESDLIIQEKDFPITETKDILAASETQEKEFASADPEVALFLIEKRVAKIWCHAFIDEKNAFEQCEQYDKHGEYPQAIRNTFIERYQGAKSLKIPKGYNSNPPDYLPKKENLSLMQRYIAYQMKTKKRFGNWSGTGAGKTLSAILASRVVNAKLTVICCPNNVINTWKDQIQGSYQNSIIYTKETISKLTNNNKEHKYLILNYEFFQQPIAKANLECLLERSTIDFIIIDEIHYSKQRTPHNASQRKKVISYFISCASNKNETLHVLGMSATPVINTLYEGKTLIELVSGLDHNDLDTKATIANCMALYQKFICYGIRYMPKYKQQLNEIRKAIDCNPFLMKIRQHKTPIELEAILVKAKTTYILEQLRPKTIIYSHYRDGIELILQDAVMQAGWKVALFNGDTKEGLEQFNTGNVDILIASSCIATGIDGLQKVCNRLIIACLPWTHAEYEQLIGRIYRQGQLKGYVDIFIPLTFAMVNGERWSWCESRWKRIAFKKSVADAAVDGVIPEGNLRDREQAHKDIMEWLNRLDQKGMHTINRSELSFQLADHEQQSSLRIMSDLARMNQQINRAISETTHKKFISYPQKWYDYHAIYTEARKEWEIKPYQEAIKWCETRPDWIIGDFGCGEAFLAQSLKNKVYSFDHIAIDDTVIACDISHIPLTDASLDVAIFSLSLMGTNFIDYLIEAKRCLKFHGHLWIAEPTSRIKDMKLFEELLDRLGFDVRNICKKDQFTFIDALKSERDINHIALENFDYTKTLE